MDLTCAMLFLSFSGSWTSSCSATYPRTCSIWGSVGAATLMHRHLLRKGSITCTTATCHLMDHTHGML